MSRKKTAGGPPADQARVRAAEWFGGGQRIWYDPASARVLTGQDAVPVPAALQVFERVTGAASGTDTVWLTMLPGFPEGSYGWAQVDRLLGDGLGPRLYVEPIGQGDSDKPRRYRYSTMERADLIEALWRHHGVHRTVVVTFDYTSLALMELLRRRMERPAGAGSGLLGCDLADILDLPVFLYRLKLTARGTGLVGEMTTLIGDAFAHLLTVGRQARGTAGPTTIYILVVDEADALAQSRAAQQMHHEDRAGVDALLAGVDSLAGEQVPVLAVMCTNRKSALDPAVLRRAAAIFHFRRPGDAQRRTVLASALDGTGIDDATISKLVSMTGESAGRPAFTYSDLTQRLIPAAVLAAFPAKPLTAGVLLDVASRLAPTPEFREAP